jgi:D-aspartate ligase
VNLTPQMRPSLAEPRIASRPPNTLLSDEGPRRLGTLRPPGFVLTMAAYYGTLAAARCLGERGVPVIIVDSERLAPALWSKYVTRRELCPPARPVDAFVDWLCERGRRDPGNVLYATSDDLAWAFAEREAELKRSFRLLTPSFEDVVRILDKGSLYAQCAAEGLRTPRTWFPNCDGLDVIAREATFPLIVKPRTQVLFRTQRKGRIVTTPSELEKAYADFVGMNRHEPRFTNDRPALAQPIIQELCGKPGVGAIYSLSGFCDHRHRLFVARAALKLAQWPRRAGVGIHFADAPVQADLAQRLQRLCERTRFTGVFEAEFVGMDGTPMLIDFNPRFFGQLGFDAARALPSPYLAYLAATEQFDRLAAEVEAARAWRPATPMVYANRTALTWTRAASLLVGRRARAPQDGSDGTPQAATTHGLTPRVVDAVHDANDVLPGLLDALQQIAKVLVHPRSVLRAAVRGC